MCTQLKDCRMLCALLLDLTLAVLLSKGKVQMRMGLYGA
jgi:hypothetical protein